MVAAVAERSGSPEGRLVGRIDELRAVDRARAAAAGGHGASLVVVSGEAGIGKSRFCDEVAGRARSAGMGVCMARCWMDGGAPPLWPWHPVLTELCGSEAADLLAADRGTTTVDPDRFARPDDPGVGARRAGSGPRRRRRPRDPRRRGPRRLRDPGHRAAERAGGGGRRPRPGGPARTPRPPVPGSGRRAARRTTPIPYGDQRSANDVADRSSSSTIVQDRDVRRSGPRTRQGLTGSKWLV
jgi:hypothetical protein